VFSVVNAVLLKQLSVHDPSELVEIAITGRDKPMFELSYPMFAAIRERAHTFNGLFAFADHDGATVVVNGVGALAGLQFVSGNYFDVLGVGASAGRVLSLEDDRTGSPPVVVVSDLYARNRLSDGVVIGRPIAINGVRCTIVGVAPPGFTGVRVGNAPDIYIPFSAWEQVSGRTGSLKAGDFFWLEAMGRLASGATPASARTDVNAAFRGVVAQVYPGRTTADYSRLLRKFSFDVAPAATGGRSHVRETFASPLKVLMAAVVILLVVTCANIAGLLTSRGIARRPEMALRASLGAARMRLVQQLVTENVVLAITGAALGIGVAVAGCAFLRAMLGTTGDPMSVNLLPDARVLVFTASVSVVAVLLFGVAPAWRTSRSTLDDARPTARYTSPQSMSARVLVVSQVALSLPLAAAAALLGTTLYNLRAVDNGFDGAHLLSFVLTPRQAGLDTARARLMYDAVIARLAALPGVQSVATSSKPPLGRGFHQLVSVDGLSPTAGENLSAGITTVSAGYFHVTGWPMIRGKEFTDADDGTAPKVAVINEAAARAWFPDRESVGQRLGFGGPDRSRDLEIIGVVRDGKYDKLRETSPITVYTPQRQTGGTRLAILARSSRNSSALLATVRQVVASIAPGVPIERLSTVNTIVDESLVSERLLTTMSAFFGILAVLLSCVGLYGLIAFAVARRAREIGIRMAIGASRPAILAMILRENAAMLACGVVAGVMLTGAAASTMRVFASQLYGVHAVDPIVLTLTGAAVFVAGVVATLAPASRAARTDPMEALRVE
jgi:predicted permease